MKPFEQLIEALENTDNLETFWLDYFDNILEARRILRQAEKENLDEYEIASLSFAMNEDPPNTVEEINIIKNKCFLRLKKILEFDK